MTKFWQERLNRANEKSIEYWKDKAVTKPYIVMRLIKEFELSGGITVEAENVKTGIIGHIPVYKDEQTARLNSEGGMYPVVKIEMRDPE